MRPWSVSMTNNAQNAADGNGDGEDKAEVENEVDEHYGCGGLDQSIAMFVCGGSC